MDAIVTILVLVAASPVLLAFGMALLGVFTCVIGASWTGIFSNFRRGHFIKATICLGGFCLFAGCVVIGPYMAVMS